MRQNQLQRLGLGIRRRQKSAPSSVEGRSGAAALVGELGEQGWYNTLIRWWTRNAHPFHSPRPPLFEHPEKRALSHSPSQRSQRWPLRWDIEGSGASLILALQFLLLWSKDCDHHLLHSHSRLFSLFHAIMSRNHVSSVELLKKATVNGYKLKAHQKENSKRNNTKYVKKTLRNQNIALRRYEKWVQTLTRFSSKRHTYSTE